MARVPYARVEKRILTGRREVRVTKEGSKISITPIEGRGPYELHILRVREGGGEYIGVLTLRGIPRDKYESILKRALEALGRSGAVHERVEPFAFGSSMHLGANIFLRVKGGRRFVENAEKLVKELEEILR